ncbi:MAG TPA: sigma-54 dependent transcriptional regulator [Roseiflexaceae bacterium]|jgi:nitrogen regulation protein NR(I)|nr:sigma-54 dependent transcriptional regulator [Roseiflexaceae bacterium]
MAVELEGTNILIADDEESIRELFRDILEPEGAAVKVVGSGTEALKAIDAEEPDLAIFDVRMPAPDGLALLQQLRSKGVDIPVLIVTAQDSSTATIEAMQRGAYDYISKPFDPEEVLHVVQRAIEHRRLTKRVHALEQQVTKDPRDIMIGRSAPMQQVYKMIGRVASSDATVLITGESGTGKELVAHVLHRTSLRREGPFIAVNCAALPETLLESELFGHEKGAFTGAMAQRKGRFEQANKGTIFLDEVGEMSASTQKKLLRVLQERTFERVGGNVAVKVDVRVIAATNRDLLHDVTTGNFRDDLYYRLNVINIHMPPLRERKDDISLLVEHFLQKHRVRAGEQPRITEDAMQMLIEYDWPGNVRQLENSIERAAVLAQGKVVSSEHLQLNDSGSTHDQMLTSALGRLLGNGGSLDDMIKEVRGRLIELALERNNGDRAAAARMLDVDERTLR